MKTILMSCAAVGMAAMCYGADAVKIPPVNYDPAKIPAYTLEDPLTFVDGRAVRSAADWEARRQEILGIFAREMYGQPPPAPEAVVTEVVDKRLTAAGYGVRKLVKMWFKADKSGPCINWLVISPRYAKGPSPVILFLNYNGNAELLPDKDIPAMTNWVRAVKGHVTDTEAIRGRMCNPNTTSTVFPIGTILARGYAVMSACYAEISPDPTSSEKKGYRQEDFAWTGVFDLWGKRDPSRTDNPTSLGAWAWVLSRGLDYAERDTDLDAKRAVVTGCSRLGKAALIAGARDTRFRVVVPNQTGGGGAPLAKRDYGENPATENMMFKHWYCEAYRKYSKEYWKTLTFDQHLLLAAVAPRALLIQGMTDSRWMDTEGEYLACRAAAKTWAFLGRGTMPDVPYPAEFDTCGIGESFGYVRRPLEHGIAACDWDWMMNFADRELGKCK